MYNMMFSIPVYSTAMTFSEYTYNLFLSYSSKGSGTANFSIKDCSSALSIDSHSIALSGIKLGKVPESLLDCPNIKYRRIYWIDI
jgi:hypothetical protein